MSNKNAEFLQQNMFLLEIHNREFYTNLLKCIKTTDNHIQRKCLKFVPQIEADKASKQSDCYTSLFHKNSLMLQFVYKEKTNKNALKIPTVRVFP